MTQSASTAATAAPHQPGGRPERHLAGRRRGHREAISSCGRPLSRQARRPRWSTVRPASVQWAVNTWTCIPERCVLIWGPVRRLIDTPMPQQSW